MIVGGDASAKEKRRIATSAIRRSRPPGRGVSRTLISSSSAISHYISSPPDQSYLRPPICQPEWISAVSEITRGSESASMPPSDSARALSSGPSSPKLTRPRRIFEIKSAIVILVALPSSPRSPPHAHALPPPHAGAHAEERGGEEREGRGLGDGLRRPGREASPREAGVEHAVVPVVARLLERTRSRVGHGACPEDGFVEAIII